MLAPHATVLNLSFNSHILTHHSPWSIGYLAILCEAANNHFDDLIVIIKACTKQNLADDVGGCIMKHNSRTQSFTCNRNRKTSTQQEQKNDNI